MRQNCIGIFPALLLIFVNAEHALPGGYFSNYLRFSLHTMGLNNFISQGPRGYLITCHRLEGECESLHEEGRVAFLGYSDSAVIACNKLSPQALDSLCVYLCLSFSPCLFVSASVCLSLSLRLTLSLLLSLSLSLSLSLYLSIYHLYFIR